MSLLIKICWNFKRVFLKTAFFRSARVITFFLSNRLVWNFNCLFYTLVVLSGTRMNFFSPLTSQFTTPFVLKKDDFIQSPPFCYFSIKFNNCSSGQNDISIDWESLNKFDFGCPEDLKFKRVFLETLFFKTARTITRIIFNIFFSNFNHIFQATFWIEPRTDFLIRI